MAKRKIISKVLIVSLIVSFILAPLDFSHFRFEGFGASAREEEIEIINTDTVWGPGERIVRNPVRIENGATLIIEKGTVVKFLRDEDDSCSYTSGLEISDGRIVAEGSPEEKIIFTRGSNVCDEYSLSFYNELSNKDLSTFRYVEFRNGSLSPKMAYNDKRIFSPNTVYAANGGTNVLDFASGNVSIENSIFKNNFYGAVRINVFEEAVDNYLEIKNSDFENNSGEAAFVETKNYFGETADIPERYEVLLKNNWYGDSSGPAYVDNPAGKGESISGPVIVEGWSAERFFPPEPEEPSNVLFLPGIKASQLYQMRGENEDKVWPPDYFDNDVTRLGLDEDGQSVNNIYTRNIVSEAPVTGKNIYKTFMSDLASLKSAGTIDDFSLFAYDWRMNVEDIAQNGTSYADEEVKSAIEELERLSENSKSQKVTIIAHSNGGLLAKALAQKLETDGKEDLVDKIVFVGTPQMGTPKSILSLLYGYDEASSPLEILIQRPEARKLAENMPGAYGLLPSEKYLERLGEPLIDFSSISSSEERTRYKKFRDAYGESIGKNEYEDFWNFLIGEEGREKPDEDEVELENKLRENILEGAYETHANLDYWTPPDNVKVIEIAGWGLDTISGVKYGEKEKTKCYAAPGAKLPSCTGMGEYEPVYEPRFTVDGDKVVTAPSALMLENAEGKNNVEEYWVDLHGYNIDPIINNNKNHGNIFEVDSILEFISNIIKNVDQTSSLPKYIKKSRPDDYDNAKPRIRMSLYSPLDIHLRDEAGNHTGPKTIIDENQKEKTIFETEIPNSYYYQFGERKYVGFQEGENIHIEMEGYADGAYTLKLEEIETTGTGEQKLSDTAFVNLPTSAKTKASLDIPSSGLSGLSELKADFDGDQKNDYSIAPIPNGEATLPEQNESVETRLTALEESVKRYYQEGLIKNKQEKNKLLAEIELIQKERELGKMIENNPFLKLKLKKLFLAIIQKQLENQLDLMIRRIEKDKKNYSVSIKSFLIGDLRWIKDNL